MFSRSEFLYFFAEFSCGGVAERLNAAVLKTVDRFRGPWVRIPPPPPFMLINCMTRTRKVRKSKVILTITCLIMFAVLVTVADRFTTASDLEYVNSTFVSDSSRDVSINLDAMSVSMDETTDLAVVQYIVQE